MKKLNFAIFGAVMAVSLATQAFAETTIPWTKEGCESVKGTWITAHSSSDDGCDAAHCNGLNFCASPRGKNWWSALIWCKSIGRELADPETACPNGISSGNTCANLVGKISNYQSYVYLNWPANETQVYGLYNTAMGITKCAKASPQGKSPLALCK